MQNKCQEILNICTVLTNSIKQSTKPTLVGKNEQVKICVIKKCLSIVTFAFHNLRTSKLIFKVHV